MTARRVAARNASRSSSAGGTWCQAAAHREEPARPPGVGEPVPTCHPAVPNERVAASGGAEVVLDDQDAGGHPPTSVPNTDTVWKAARTRRAAARVLGASRTRIAVIAARPRGPIPTRSRSSRRVSAAHCIL